MKFLIFFPLLTVLRKELSNLIQCRRLIKPRASKGTAQESQFCRELKVNQHHLWGWRKGGVTWELVTTPKLDVQLIHLQNETKNECLVKKTEKNSQELDFIF